MHTPTELPTWTIKQEAAPVPAFKYDPHLALQGLRIVRDAWVSGGPYSIPDYLCVFYDVLKLDPKLTALDRAAIKVAQEVWRRALGGRSSLCMWLYEHTTLPSHEMYKLPVAHAIRTLWLDKMIADIAGYINDTTQQRG